MKSKLREDKLVISSSTFSESEFRDVMSSDSLTLCRSVPSNKNISSIDVTTGALGIGKISIRVDILDAFFPPA